ncbi:MAG: P1 family peptidase [Acidobacteriota bacterium]
MAELPTPSAELTIPGVTLGHGSDLAGGTGVTVILCPAGVMAAAEVRGAATGTRQFDSLVLAQHVASRAHAVVLAGGSAFGLSAADPVSDWLVEGGHGFATELGVIPIVPTAILFDLGVGDPAARPGTALVREALETAAAGTIATGNVGAGTGATVGKARGIEHAMKGGFGFVALTPEGGPTVAAAVAVNAFGDVRDPDSGRLLAGCRRDGSPPSLAGAEAVLANLPADPFDPWQGNTTLAVVMSDAALSKDAALMVSRMAFGGFHRALAPALTLYDGDLVVTLSCGTRRAHVNQIGTLAERAVGLAIAAAALDAEGLAGLPAARDL